MDYIEIGCLPFKTFIRTQHHQKLVDLHMSGLIPDPWRWHFFSNISS